MFLWFYSDNQFCRTLNYPNDPTWYCVRWFSDMVCNGWRVVILSEGLEMFSFSIMKTSFWFTDVKIVAILATGFVNDFRFLRTIQAAVSWCLSPLFQFYFSLINSIIYIAHQKRFRSQGIYCVQSFNFNFLLRRVLSYLGKGLSYK